MRPITGRAFGAALVVAGVLTQEELNQTSRIVIDASAKGVVVMYLEREMDERLLNVKTTLEGVTIQREEPG